MYYRNTAKQQSTFDKIILPASQTIPRNVTLTGLHSDNDYKAYTMLCNTKHCGGMGPEKMVTSVPYSGVTFINYSIFNVSMFAYYTKGEGGRGEGGENKNIAQQHERLS